MQGAQLIYNGRARPIVTVLTLLYWLSNFIRHRPYVAASTADVDAPQFDVVSHSVRYIGMHTLQGA